MTQLIVALDDPRALNELNEIIEAGARWFKVDPWLLLDWDTSSTALATIDDAGCSLFLDIKLYQPRYSAPARQHGWAQTISWSDALSIPL